MKTIFKYLKDQGGQFWTGFSKGLEEARRYEQERADKATERKLREKMLALDVQKAERQLQDDIRQQAALEQVGQLATQGVTEPQQLQMATPQQVPSNIALPQGAMVSPEGETQMPPPQQIPTEIKRPASKEEILAALLKTSQKNEIAAQYAKSLFPTAIGAGLQRGGFKDLDEGKAFLSQRGETARWKMGVDGLWRPETVVPVNVAQRRYTELRGQGMPHEQALEGMFDVQYGEGGARAAGAVQGKAAAEAPPGTPIPGRPALAGAPDVPGTPAPSTVPSTKVPGAVTPAPPSKPAANYPTSGRTGQGPSSVSGTNEMQPPPGLSLADQNRWRKEVINRYGQPLPANLQDVLAKGGVLEYLEGQIRKDVMLPSGQIDRSVFSRFAGPKEMEFRQRFGDLVGMELSPKETTFRQNLQSMQNLIVYLQTGKQINETEADRLKASMPQAYDPTNFLTSLDRFRGELKMIIDEQMRTGRLGRGSLGAPTTAPGRQPPPGWEFVQ